jgi:membrane fusion protein (multidrug efflux system)
MTHILHINKSKHMSKHLIIAVFSVLLLAACGSKGNDNLSKKKKELESLKAEAKTINDKITKLEEEIDKLDTSANKDENLEVVVTPVSLQTFKTYIEVQGRVDADENVSLSSQMPGTVTKINVQVGQQVSKGQVLAETDASAIYQQISDLQTNLDLASIVYKKQENLWKQKVGTEMQYLQAKSSKESLEKKMGTLNEQVRMSKIISPINGTVDAVNIKLAQQVAPGMNAITVVNFSNLKIKADVAETYSPRVKNGNEVLILFPDLGDSISGKVHYASRAINPLTRTFGVEVLLGNTKNYQPNMVAKLRINDYQSGKPQIVVPVKFIQKGTSESFVLVAENGKAVKKVITVSREYNGMAEIADGLKEGDQIITEGYDLVNDGDTIIVKK